MTAFAGISCAQCGGTEFWDNRATKKNPKQPDLKCRNRDCAKGIWLSDAQKSALGASAAPAKQNGAGPSRPPVILDKMMRACVAAAQKIATEQFVDGEVKGLDHALTLNMAVTLYISRCRNEGILEVEKKALAELAIKAAAEKMEAQRKAELLAEAERQRQAALPPAPWEPAGYNAIPALVQNDDDLPF